MRDDHERLQDILEAIAKIEKYTRIDQAAFNADERTQVWVIHHLEIIGEAANHISVDLQRQHPEIPWSKIIGMRHVLSHHYFGIDLDIVWQVVEQDLPDLKTSVANIL